MAFTASACMQPLDTFVPSDAVVDSGPEAVASESVRQQQEEKSPQAKEPVDKQEPPQPLYCRDWTRFRLCMALFFTLMPLIGLFGPMLCDSLLASQETDLKKAIAETTSDSSREEAEFEEWVESWLDHLEEESPERGNPGLPQHGARPHLRRHQGLGHAPPMRLRQGPVEKFRVQMEAWKSVHMDQFAALRLEVGNPQLGGQFQQLKLQKLSIKAVDIGEVHSYKPLRPILPVRSHEFIGNITCSGAVNASCPFVLRTGAGSDIFAGSITPVGAPEATDFGVKANKEISKLIVVVNSSGGVLVNKLGPEGSQLAPAEPRLLQLVRYVPYGPLYEHGYGHVEPSVQIEVPVEVWPAEGPRVRAAYLTDGCSFGSRSHCYFGVCPNQHCFSQRNPRSSAVFGGFP